MTVADQAVFPFPEAYIRSYAAKLFQALGRRECATSVWVATSGRRVTNRFVLNHLDLFAKELPNYDRWVFAYIEPLDLTEETQSGYIRLIGKGLWSSCQKNSELKVVLSENETKIFDDEQATYAKLLEALRATIAKIVSQDFEVALFLGEIDNLAFVNATFCNNLRALWNKFDTKLHYVFLIKDTRLIFGQNHFGEEFGYLFFQNLIYVPVSKDNEEYIIDYFAKKTGQTLTSAQKDLLSKMCDGHPYFLKLAVETLAKGESAEAIASNYEIRATSERILEVFTDQMKKVLGEIATKQLYQLPSGDEIHALEALGIVRKESEGYYQIFCSLFRDAVLKRTLPEVTPGAESQKKFYFDEAANAIIIAGKPIDEQLTRQEYEILGFFLKQPNKLHSRDTIAEALWGKESYEKYSDWAIDQLMSKLRKKLGKLGLEEKILVTVRGRGYKLTY